VGADERSAGFISRLFFSWVFPIIKLGHTRTLTEEDVTPSIPERDDCGHHLDVFEENIRRDLVMLNDGKGKHRPPTSKLLGRSIWKSFSEREYMAIALKLTSDAATYVSPLMIPYFIRYAENPSSFSVGKIFGIAVANLLAPFVVGFCNQWWYHLVMLDGLHARTALQAAVYSKLLRIRTPGDSIMNAQSTDCSSVEWLYQVWIYTWALPLQIVTTTVLMYLMIGWPIFLGLFTIVALVFLQQKVMKRQFAYTATASASSDARIQLIGELIKGISVIKVNAWEKIFEASVEKAREAELSDRRKVAYIEAVNTSIAEMANISAMLLTFGAHALFINDPNNVLSPERVFSTIALFGTLRMPITLIPMLVRMIASGLVSVHRLSDILYARELNSYVQVGRQGGEGKHALVIKSKVTFVHEVETREEDVGESRDDEADEESKTARGSDVAKTARIDLSTSGAEVPLNDTRFKLTFDDEFCLDQGSFTVVTGRVASGKSSLLLAILGEMYPASTEPFVHVYGSIAYCAQNPWIQNGTVKDNVLFGRDYHEETYSSVIRACALEADLRALPAGENTEIGERGINLSGGQKARIALARACYSNADILVLDDIISAVDAHVARHITDECILGFLKNRGKTVILATHQALCFPKSDKFVVMDEGSLVFDGKYEEAVSSRFYSDQMLGTSSTASAALVAASIVRSETKDTTASPAAADEDVANDECNNDSVINKSEADAGANLVTSEDRETGAVGLETYMSYVSMVGYTTSFAILLLVVGVNVQSILSNWWLSQWANAVAYDTDPKLSYYIWGYFGFGFSVMIFMLLFRVVFVWGGLRAGAETHKRMISALLGAPQSFFDTNLIGRLINLFTADMKAIDEKVVQQLGDFFNRIFMILSVAVLVIIVIPPSAIAMVPLFVLYYLIQKVYRSTSRELKRFDSTTQSPIFNHFAETFAGLSTIRAFRCQERVLGETKKRIDYNTRFWIKNNSANKWLGMRLDFIGAGIAGFTGLACVIVIHLGQRIDPGLIGLVLSYVTLFTSLLNWGVRNFSEAEQSLVAIERTRQLGLSPQEETNDELTNIPKSWPSNGEVRFVGVSARYRPGLPQVIKNMSLIIPACSKVGVCGRTASGKTSLLKLLFRLIPVESGTIEVDGLDISRVNLEVLRSRMTMISQDPVLFAGTLRHSLDPADLYSEEELWEAIVTVGMGNFLGEEGLEMEISEGGSNVSAGQRQLLCMARALVQKTKLLVLDEATSNMDVETDELIQVMLKDKFSDCTVITIAHRLDTIVEYDQVVVLEDGGVAEMGPPSELINVPGGAFAAMLNEQTRSNEQE